MNQSNGALECRFLAFWLDELLGESSRLEDQKHAEARYDDVYSLSCGLLPSEHFAERTSGAKARKHSGYYGTAEAVPLTKP